MASLLKQVESHISAAADTCEMLIKDAVCERMKQEPRPHGFVFAMGSHFWINKAGEPVSTYSRTQSIDDVCDAHLDAFGTITWRIDWRDGKLVEQTDW